MPLAATDKSSKGAFTALDMLLLLLTLQHLQHLGHLFSFFPSSFLSIFFFNDNSISFSRNYT